ncbi:hypothetical protein CYMTET_49899 [Cymbomonas tetramitiformis]|uniref:Tryptophan synthase beta chain-like PALP domain-containing protein n=1 Tax=Cymbomonas tetramitiformis TaxID=36881 RepID=A0AAE0ETF1_9CHLO|nr:hypothetical protein CYMTET_49899 [Cymbomonas tetramitiformis]
MLEQPDTQVQEVWIKPSGGNERARLLVVRDDLLHPLMGGNKLRKLDALIPELQQEGCTDVVTCGGSQSAHIVAVAVACAERAVACAERGLRAHLLLRGEPFKTPTGYNLLAGMYGKVTYVPRSEYADRDTLLSKYSQKLEDECPDGSTVPRIIREGASDPEAVLGLLRLARFLATCGRLAADKPATVIIDSGTGTTAISMALAFALLRLPWQVVGVRLAGDETSYHQAHVRLAQAAAMKYGLPILLPEDVSLRWVERSHPRRFGKVLPGEIAECQRIARETGILLDPIYTLAGWQVAVQHLQETDAVCGEVLLLHTGGTMGMFGLAQRYPDEFNTASQAPYEC